MKSDYIHFLEIFVFHITVFPAGADCFQRVLHNIKHLLFLGPQGIHSNRNIIHYIAMGGVDKSQYKGG